MLCEAPLPNPEIEPNVPKKVSQNIMTLSLSVSKEGLRKINNKNLNLRQPQRTKCPWIKLNFDLQ